MRSIIKIPIYINIFFFKLILNIGNYFNKENPILGQANGFKLKILPQLDQIKLVVNNTTTNLMSLLVSLCKRKYLDSMNLRDDFKSVENASKSNCFNNNN